MMRVALRGEGAGYRFAWGAIHAAWLSFLQNGMQGNNGVPDQAVAGHESEATGQ
jgi:hypothetical protein